MKLVLVLLAAMSLSGQLMQDASREAPRTENLRVVAPDDSGRELRVRLVLPEGDGPFPLAVINHGSPRTADERRDVTDPQYKQLVSWFVDRGYAVALPLRRGYGRNGGRWNETFGPCNNPDYFGAGLETARDIEAAIKALRERDDIEREATIVVGHSAGGWGTLALASLNLKGVRAYINFSGGRGGHNDGRPELNCSADALVEAARRYGRTSSKPTLWLYAENDTYFPSSLAERMYEAFTDAGGKARFKMLPPFAGDGHLLANEGEDVWGPILARFLKVEDADN